MTKEKQQRYDKIYINGEWVTPAAPEFSTLTNPATGGPSGEAVRASAADVDKAVAAAKAAFPAWSQTSAQERIGYLKAVAAEYEKRMDAIEQAVMLDLGAPIAVTQLMHSRSGPAVINSVADALGAFEFEQRHGATLITKEPVGVAGLISAWNGPALMFCLKICTALAAGCTIVYKPAELATHTAMVCADALIAAGLPKGVFNFVLGKGSVIGEAISTHPDIDYVSFTGSTSVGARIAQHTGAAAKKAGLELGGKSAFIVMPDAEIAKAAQDAVMSVMLNSGQICAAGTRTLVPHQLKDDFIDAMCASAAAVKVGKPDTDAFMGPVISQHQWEVVQNYIQIGIDEGARLVFGGLGKPEGLEDGFYVKPTIFADVTNDMRIAREEIFGPVASVITYKTVDEAIAIANDSPFGLSGYVYGADHDAMLDVSRRLRTGNVRINTLEPDPGAPWGGYKASGVGREAGEWGIEDMMEIKSINNYFTDAA